MKKQNKARARMRLHSNARPCSSAQTQQLVTPSHIHAVTASHRGMIAQRAVQSIASRNDLRSRSSRRNGLETRLSHRPCVVGNLPTDPQHGRLQPNKGTTLTREGGRNPVKASKQQRSIVNVNM